MDAYARSKDSKWISYYTVAAMVLVITFLLCSCEEYEYKYCYQCEVTISATVDGKSATSKSETMVCGKTQEEITEIETLGSGGNATLGGITKCHKIRSQ